MPISTTSTFSDTGTAVSYKVLNFKSVNYRLTNIDSSNRFKQKFLGQRWSFELEAPPRLRSEAFQIAFLQRPTQVLGDSIQFNFVPPVIATKSGNASGTVTVSLLSSTNPSYNFTKGSKTIPVSGGSGTLKKGDFIKFSDHDKVYQLTADTNLDGSTLDSISIFPGLFQTLTTGATVSYDNVVFTVTTVGDEFEIEMDENGVFEYKLNLIEHI